MFVFFGCVAESVAEHGVRGLLGLVPGGEYAYSIAESAWKKYRERKKDAALRNDIQEIAAASFEEVKQAAIKAVHQVVPPVADVSDAEKLALETYLSQIPAALRQSLKRPDDPTGTTVPATFALNSPDDVLKILPPRPPRFAPGQALPGKPGWVLADLLGVGGFGEVWLAKHPRMISLSGAVKFYHGRQTRDLHHESTLIDRVMAAGRHPGIVPVLDVHLEGDAPWVMFEYVSGGDLVDEIRTWQGKPQDQRVRHVLDALRMLTEAVGHFHRLPTPVVHRDLKPSNILRDSSQKILRITDFGIGAISARAALDEERRNTSTRGGRLLSYLRGSYTPLYASPQQRDGADPDPRDDVHAIGVIAYQMFTGSLNQGIGADFADDLREVGVPAELIDLIGRCVAQKPDRRPQDAASLREQLHRIETGFGSDPPEEPPISTAEGVESVIPPTAPSPTPADGSEYTERTRPANRTEIGLVIGAIVGGVAGGIMGWQAQSFVGVLFGGLGGWVLGTPLGGFIGRMCRSTREKAFILLEKASNRGKRGEYAQAIELALRTIELEPDEPKSWNILAWLWATCPDDLRRNGPGAVEYATKACELTKWQAPGILDTLAAAYAECGQFNEAVKWVREAMRNSTGTSKARYFERMELYLAGKPYRTESYSDETEDAET